MRASRPARLLPLVLVLARVPSAAAAAEPAGSGERKIPEATPAEPAPAKAELPAPSRKAARPGKAEATAAAQPPRGHRAGKPPKTPRPTLPEGAPPPAPDAEARRQIVGGPTTDDVAAGKNDPELRELREAERILFPRPPRGARAGWSWDLPAPVDDGSATVEASGLPAGSPLGTGAAPAVSGSDAAWLRALSMPSLPVRLDARVVKYLEFYRDDQRGKNILRVWAKKSGRFTRALKAEFARAGLSPDLMWLSLIESGHNPTILSPAGAAGLWQFIPESARLYGLTVDRWVDERLDPARSTEAAVRYLADLRSRFGTWELAMAAYNMGHGALLRAMRKFNTNDFWTLSRYEAGLPWETTLYVPKILATAIAMSNPKEFGIDGIAPDPSISFDTVSVGPNTDLSDVARAAEASLEEIRGLNAQYLTGRTPPASVGPGPFRVRVPSGRALVTEQRLADASRRPGTSPTEPHVVRFGDTIDAIAAEYGVSPQEIATQNHMSCEERVNPGSVLLVPVRTATGAEDPPPEEVVVVPARGFSEPGRTRLFYRVLAGDRLAEIANAFGVTGSQIALWNTLDEGASLQQGMTLQVFVAKDFDASRVRCLREHEARVLVAGTEPFIEYFEAQNKRKRIVVTARKGDTLTAIGRRYGMSTGMMERINRASAQTPLATGQRVIVYAKEDAPAVSAPDPDVGRALSAVASPAPDALPPLPAADPTEPNGPRAVAR